MNKNQKIECNVESCIHLDCERELCKLKKIKVSCNCDQANCKDDTICDSYKEK